MDIEAIKVGEALLVNGIPIDDESIARESACHVDEADPTDAARRALVVRELLRQRAVELGLIGADAVLDDVTVDTLLDRELTHLPQPGLADCEHYYARHPAGFRRNDLVYASHILFGVTDRVPVVRLRQKAEAMLADVIAAPETFEEAARASSNCPSAAVGGSLGQLMRGMTVPEFEAVVFGTDALGVLPGLVNTRFGFHIVRIDRRVPGELIPFDEVAARIADFLSDRVRRSAIRQYVSILAGGARIDGIVFDAANGPLVQ